MTRYFLEITTHITVHIASHFIPHFAHHFVGILKHITHIAKSSSSVEEWIVFKRIMHFHLHSHAESLKHLILHFIHSLDHIVSSVIPKLVMNLFNVSAT